MKPRTTTRAAQAKYSSHNALFHEVVNHVRSVLVVGGRACRGSLELPMMRATVNGATVVRSTDANVLDTVVRGKVVDVSKGIRNLNSGLISGLISNMGVLLATLISFKQLPCCIDHALSVVGVK